MELDSATEQAMPSAHLVGDIVVEPYLLSVTLYAQGYVLFGLVESAFLAVRQTSV
jgi:hypothetical protein